MIELLVAVVIMAVGILGIAGLQVVALQQNRSALMRAEASQLANDVMDRIRVNPDVIYSALIDADPSSTARNCNQDNCTPTEMAEFDIAQWKCSLNSTDADGNPFSICNTFGIKGSLPEAEGSISKSGNIYTVKVRWVHDSDGHTSSITIRSRAE